MFASIYKYIYISLSPFAKDSVGYHELKEFHGNFEGSLIYIYIYNMYIYYI